MTEAQVRHRLEQRMDQLFKSLRKSAEIARSIDSLIIEEGYSLQEGDKVDVLLTDLFWGIRVARECIPDLAASLGLYPDNLDF